MIKGHTLGNIVIQIIDYQGARFEHDYSNINEIIPFLYNATVIKHEFR